MLGCAMASPEGTRRNGADERPYRPSSSACFLCAALAMILGILCIMACTGGDSSIIEWDDSAAFTGLESGTVSVGDHHACHLKTDGSVQCWGLNGYGQSSPPPGTFVHLSARWNHSCAVLSGGSVVCWGNDDFGQSTPPDGKFESVETGGSHTCGVRTDDAIRCWGYDGEGQSSPPRGKFFSVSAGLYHSCGVRTNGSVA